MKLLSKLNGSRLRECAKCAAMLALGFALAVPAYAQAGGTSPWENAVNVLQQAFTGTIAKSHRCGWLTFAFGLCSAASASRNFAARTNSG